MVPLDRSLVTAPPDWADRVRKALSDERELRRKATAFERLALNGEKRRSGFVAYAGHLLVEGELPAVWRCEEVKIALHAMTDGHCAYCQASVEDSSYAPVEHFQPKSLFPTLAYEVGNYFYSCQRCNLAKLDKWPASGGYVRPDVGDPSRRFRFKKSGWVKVARGDEDALATVRDFELNRRGLRRRRRGVIQREMKKLAAILRISGLTEDQLRKAVKPFFAERLSRFSEAINQNVRRACARSFPQAAL